uniref:UBA domain-containing protein n=1 Tax=Fagus sylvatica TaxID=28930 RepID=A0A2N9FT56_FAGSY
MSPASRSKSKDKKASKEPQKPSAKSSGPANAGSGTPASAYNPLLGTFHTLEMSPTSSPSPLHSNGRFGNMDETDEHPGGLLVAGVEYDSVSNNGSWSGESEDHKEKSSNLLIRQETIPGAEGDKREKIRQKNERKHQRQKERRAQELHERCSGYLMSRKLEALAQQLVVMGFPHERATMALILNEGKVEQSVNWLFEGGEEAEKHGDQNLSGRSNLKIDISEELARIADMETRYKCSKQDVERAVVACEGDLEKAVETLEAMKLDPPSAPPKPEETGDPPTIKKWMIGISTTQKQQFTVVGSSEPGTWENVQSLCSKRIQPKLEMGKTPTNCDAMPLPAEKRWAKCRIKSFSFLFFDIAIAGVGSSTSQDRNPLFSCWKSSARNSEGTNYNDAEATISQNKAVMKSNGFLQQIPSARSLSPNNPSSNQMYHQLQYKQQQQQFLPSSIPGDSPGTGRGNGLWSRTGASPTLAAASSLGLFSGLGSTGSSGASSPVDWNTGGSMSHLDYASIDWTLDRNLSSTSPNGLWLGLPSFTRNNTHMYDLNTSGVNAQPAMRSVPIPNGVSISGLQDNGVVAADTSAGSREWTSPFEGKDLFSLPRRFVSSPSL